MRPPLSLSGCLSGDMSFSNEHLRVSRLHSHKAWKNTCDNGILSASSFGWIPRGLEKPTGDKDLHFQRWGAGAGAPCSSDRVCDPLQGHRRSSGKSTEGWTVVICSPRWTGALRVPWDGPVCSGDELRLSESCAEILTRLQVKGRRVCLSVNSGVPTHGNDTVLQDTEVPRVLCFIFRSQIN